MPSTAAGTPTSAPSAATLPGVPATAFHASIAKDLSAAVVADPHDANSIAMVVDAPRTSGAQAATVQLVEFKLPHGRTSDLSMLVTLPDVAASEAKGNTPLVEMATALHERGLAEAVDTLRRHNESEKGAATDSLAASAMVSTSLSVGYVLWLARGGALAASLLSALPAWAMVDPLPVLSRMQTAAERDGDEGLEDDDSAIDGPDDAVESLFTKARRFAREASSRAPAVPELTTATRGAHTAAPTGDIAP